MNHFSTASLGELKLRIKAIAPSKIYKIKIKNLVPQKTKIGNLCEWDNFSNKIQPKIKLVR